MSEQSYASKVMNIRVKQHEGMFATHSHWVAYIDGHRDARHAAAEHAAQADARIAELEAEVHNLNWALGTPGYEQMATPEDQAAHEVGAERVNAMLAKMEANKAAHDAAMLDAARLRWLDEAALTVDMVSDGDNQTVIEIVIGNQPATIFGADLRDAVDKAMDRAALGPTA